MTCWFNYLRFAMFRPFQWVKIGKMMINYEILGCPILRQTHLHPQKKGNQIHEIYAFPFLFC